MEFKRPFCQCDMLNAYLLKIHLCKLCNKFISQRKTSKQTFQCEYCQYGMLNQYLLNCHTKICAKNKDNLQKCNICDKEFHSSQLLFQHYRKCGKFICFQCDYPFISTKAPNSHIQRCHRTQGNAVNKVYKCSIVNTYAKTGRNCTLIVCLNMVEMMYTKFHHMWKI